jgi:hypothetical protein
MAFVRHAPASKMKEGPSEENSMPRLLTVILLLGAATMACADYPQDWSFDLATTGQNVSWTAPTALPPTADWYTVDWQLTSVIVTVKYSVLPAFDVNVTDQIPAENRTGEATADGPAPLVAVSQHVAYPDPPATPSFAGDLVIGLNATGYGYATLTNITLGTMQVSVPPFGLVTVQIKGVRVQGTLHAEAWWYPVGDLNCDNTVGFGDINPFVLALTSPTTYATMFPGCRLSTGDINGDGAVNFGDINPFVALLTGN